ncbi:MAG: hypothetical protein KDE31_07845, partial [Caldilineaceae bacterium]|nr:hypothetical protein [Caldilineaceae bacterium]
VAKRRFLTPRREARQKTPVNPLRSLRLCVKHFRISQQELDKERSDRTQARIRRHARRKNGQHRVYAIGSSTHVSFHRGVFS